ncbi:MAG: FAD-binding oxidoreductase, partial [Chloroflexi bacterium]|nr:FAD-binding oxidoreductase [Chloroflexota bacterium]
MATKTKRTSLIGALEGIVGAEFVLHTPEDMVVFEADGSIGKSLPQVVVFPSTTEQVAQIVRLANSVDVPIVPRGAGTGLSGGAVAVKGGIVVTLTRMNRI